MNAFFVRLDSPQPHLLDKPLISLNSLRCLGFAILASTNLISGDPSNVSLNELNCLGVPGP